MINKWRALDFVPVIAEFYIGVYLYKENKKHFAFNLLFDIKILNLLKDTLYTSVFLAITISLMVGTHIISPRFFSILTGIAVLYLSYTNSYCIVLLFTLPLHKVTGSGQVIHMIQRRRDTIVPYVIWSLISAFMSTVVLQLVFNAEFTGHKLGIFIVMNVMMFFNVVKKTSANFVLICSSDMSFTRKIVARFLNIGCICTASALKIVSFAFIDSRLEDYIVMYSVLYNKSYVESVKELKQKCTPHKIYLRHVAYPYMISTWVIFCRMYNMQFFSMYQISFYYMRVYLLVIEIIHSCLVYQSLVDNLNKNMSSDYLCMDASM